MSFANDIHKMDRLLDKISPGPWKIEPHDDYDKDIRINGRLIICDNDDMDHAEAEANAKFIALAREIMPRLISIMIDKG